MTLQEWLQKGEALLRAGPHAERARCDAELLLRHVLNHERAALLVRWNEKMDEMESASYLALIERRQAGEPIQYIIGEAEFYGLPFRVTPDVLIPRPETEHLVEKTIALAQGFDRPRIADVGTGSGVIAVALALVLPQAFVTAIDLSAPALAIARENAELNGIAERIRFERRDLLEMDFSNVSGSTRMAEERFEIVVSNPPYIPRGDRASLAVEVREYEPALALFAGDDGLNVYRRLIHEAFGALVHGGFIALEIGYGQAKRIRELLEASGFSAIEFTPDLQGIERVASAMRS